MHDMSKPSLVDFSAIPEELKELKQWVVHKKEGL